MKLNGIPGAVRDAGPDAWGRRVIEHKLERSPADLEDRRMVFNAAVSNNDDHPRNHALLRRPKGWRLSPAYDLVPAPVISLERRGLALTVGDYGRTASIYNLLSQAGRFGLSPDVAREEIDRLVAVVRHWRDSFFICGVSVEDIETIAPAMLPECFFHEKRPDA